MSDVFVVGALHLDVVVDAPRLPRLDETVMGQQVAYRFGGKGGNQALAAARAGAKVAMAGRVGSDQFGQVVLETLNASGVDHAQVLQVSGATGMSVAIVEQGGEYGAVVVSGVNQSIDPAEVVPGLAKVVVLQNEIPEAVNIAASRAKAADAKIVLNAAPARPTATALMQIVDVLVVNRVEAEQMTGETGLSAEDAAAALASLGPKQVVVTSGREGSVIFDGASTQRINPPVQADGSAHGAGDCFVGALAHELAAGAGLGPAVEFASAAAAHFVQTPPDARKTLSRRDLDQWIAQL